MNNGITLNNIQPGNNICNTRIEIVEKFKRMGDVVRDEGQDGFGNIRMMMYVIVKEIIRTTIAQILEKNEEVIALDRSLN